MNARKRIIALTIALAGLLPLAAGGCMTGAGSVEKIEDMHIYLDMDIAMDLSLMTDIAKYIYVGKYTGFDSTWNSARNPNNILEEDPETYRESRLYRFHVTEVLKGEQIGDEILIAIRYSQQRKITESDAKWDRQGKLTKEATYENEISFVVHDPLYIEPELNAEYILFLDENRALGVYYWALEPFSIKVMPEGDVALQSKLINMTDEYFAETVRIGENREIDVYTDAGGGIEDTISGQTFDSIKAQILGHVLNSQTLS